MLGLFHRLPMFPKTEKYHYCWGDPFDPYASGPEIPAEGVVAPELVKTDRKDLRGETQPTKISLGGRNNHYKYVWVISLYIYMIERPLGTILFRLILIIFRAFWIIERI
jgi:hypothetical protein